MNIAFSNLVNIVYTNNNKEEPNIEKLIAGISVELLNRGCKCRTLPLEYLVKYKSDSDHDYNDKNKYSCDLIDICTNPDDDINNKTLNTILFISNGYGSSNAVIYLINTLKDWLYDFRFDRRSLSSVHFMFVFYGDTKDDLNNIDVISELMILLNSLGSKPLFNDVYMLQPVNIHQIILLVNKICEAQDDAISSFMNDVSYSDTHETSDEEFDIENLGLSNNSMVSDKQRESLTKQGYKLIGNHSAVKLCRWTKCRVRGHGGCYKHTFYGINSNQCMEFTPSLACANKCVFCWRHHTNPVSTRWKWEVDDPKFIVEEAIKSHIRLVKELNGIFDTRRDRFDEAMKIRHCALSLVGEPIMYPRINELLAELHKNEISTFLVTNAQFPNEIIDLTPVTQLYLSIDASDEKSLKKIDRPLFRDFWCRFQKCIENLKYRKERTVFRLTMVLDYNMTDHKDEIKGYADLIKIGEPDFIEIKAVTYCGTVHNNAITMKNVPWHDQIVDYAKALIDISEYTRDNYNIACEHRHSCCILIAKKCYYFNDKWHTWINYPLFNKLALEGKEFTGLDYSCETPSWALFGSYESGFDPEDTRVYPKGKNKHKLKGL